MKEKKKDPKLTRQAILSSAIQVFAKKSYTAASIRMIATRGGFAHALIRYYYPTKADLFDAVAEQICSALFEAAQQAVRAVSSMGRAEGFSEYVGRLVAFSRHHPAVFRIILLNLSAETVETVPGRTRFLGTIEAIREQLIDILDFKASRDDVCRFTDSFNALLFYYLGTPESAAWLLHLDPDSDAYYEWVHRTLVDVFLPALEGLF